MMFEGVRHLGGAPNATGGEGRWRRPYHAIEPISAFDSGMEPSVRAPYLAYSALAVIAKTRFEAYNPSE